MSKLLFLMIVGFYAVFVVLPNYMEYRNYNKCAADSITEEEAIHFSYNGNVLDDVATPKTCSDNNGENTFENRSIFLPPTLQ